MKELNSNDMNKVSGGKVEIRKEENGEYSLYRTIKEGTYKTEAEAKQALENFAEKKAE